MTPVIEKFKGVEVLLKSPSSHQSTRCRPSPPDTRPDVLLSGCKSIGKLAPQFWPTAFPNVLVIFVDVRAESSVKQWATSSLVFTSWPHVNRTTKVTPSGSGPVISARSSALTASRSGRRAQRAAHRLGAPSAELAAGRVATDRSVMRSTAKHWSGRLRSYKRHRAWRSRSHRLHTHTQGQDSLNLQDDRRHPLQCFHARRSPSCESYHSSSL